MKHRLALILALICGINTLEARPVDVDKAKAIGQRFLSAKTDNKMKTNDLQLVHTGISTRNEACFFVFNSGSEGFVIVSADDRFRPIVGYSDEGPFETENMSPELAFYLDKVIEARTSRDAVLFDDTAEEWQSVAADGTLPSRNGGRGVDYICQTKWNQDSPYNYYAPEASSGPNGRCYAGCVATAMSQVMKRWDHPTQGTGSHAYNCHGYGRLEAHFGETTYDWEHMPDRLGGNSTQEEIEAVALLMYHCGVAVNMGFSPNGSGANSFDVPRAIKQYFSYSGHAVLRDRDAYSLDQWQDLLKETFDLGWPVYYSGFSETAGHAFVCDGYDDNDLFHFNWGWGGSSDGWFVIDEIDYAGWAQAVFNYVPSDVYDYMPLQPENLEVVTLGDDQYSATINWTNPTQDIHFNSLAAIDQVVVCRNGKAIYTEDNVTPGADMSFTDHYMPAMVSYSVYAITHNAKGLSAVEDGVLLGPTCFWSFEATSSDPEGWSGGYISLVNAMGVEIGQLTANADLASRNLLMPIGHVDLIWNHPSQSIDQISFTLKDADDHVVTSFEGPSADMMDGLFFVANNNCNSDLNLEAPQNLTVRREDGKVVLQWNAVSDEVIHYLIYRDQLMVDLSDANEYTDDLSDDAYHSYFVTALTLLGESGPSNTCDIQGEDLCEAPTDLQFEMANNKVKLTWNAVEDESVTGYFIYRRTKGQAFKRIKSLVSTTYSDNVNSLPNDIYEYAVAAYYSGTDCTSGLANTLEHPELHSLTVNRTAIPQNLTCQLSDNVPTLSWDVALAADTYNLYRNGALIAEGLTETTFTDETLAAQQYYLYYVTGKSADMESSPSNMVLVSLATHVNESIASDAPSLYPNPTSGQVFIEGEGLLHVTVFNIMGQEMQQFEAQEDSIVIDLTPYPDGTYFIKAVAENGNITKKVIKIQ